MKEFTEDQKINFFKKITHFDWNIYKYEVSEDHQNDITLLESIMISITNDLGMSSPHIAYTIYVEWIKFMVLNLMKIELEKEECMKPLNLNVDGKNVDAYTGFIAPPYIDQFWAKIYPTREYMAFCKKIFGGFLMRNQVNNFDYDLGIKYEDTLKYVSQASDVVKFFEPLWPKMKNSRDLVDDYRGFISLTVPELYLAFLKIDEFLRKKILASDEKVSKCSSYSNLQRSRERALDGKLVEQRLKLTLDDATTLSMNIFKDIYKEHIMLKSPLRSNETKSEVKYVGANICLKEYLHNMKQNIVSIKLAFRLRLKRKFLLDDETAERWIEEYFIYLALLRKNTAEESHAVPPHIILEVWKTHYEFFENYISTISLVFGKRHIYPDDFCDPYLHSKASKKRYKNTLKEYRILTGDKPEPKIWISVDNLKKNRCDLIKLIDERTLTKANIKKFKNIQTQYTSINIHRLCIAKFMLSSERMDYSQTRTQRSLSRHPTIQTRLSQRILTRKKFKKQGRRYLWRKEFPHCKNIYGKKKIKEVIDNKEIIFKQEDKYIFEEQKEGNIFKEQGIVFVSDPYDRRLYDREEYKKDLLGSVSRYWEAEVKVTDVDDLCDSFLLRFDFGGIED